ncbi:ribbon-helix-helix protein, CopG family [Planktothrix prolifica]|uniref:ribbon-helix-helix protein, CopG family n=1 Tax=Planktothrix prolifica TaxID=54307 RepID=UPI0005C56D76|nr:ribbon-helix-helix protein, CopG family [Planktothrix prolifica]
MSREKKIQFNVNEKEYERLKSHAESEGLSMAEVLRDYIKTLTIELNPNPNQNFKLYSLT